MKKIAVNTVKSFLKENRCKDTYTKTFRVGEATFEVAFHTALSVDEKSTFIKRMITGCFDAAGNFRPEYVSPMLRATIMQMCTNIPALTLKNETDPNGAPALDLDGMNELYLAMDLDNVQDTGYQTMMNEMVHLCGQAIDWKRSTLLTNRNTDSALYDLLSILTAKVEGLDTDSLMQYAGILADGTKDLGEGGILAALIKARESKATD